MEMWDAVSIVGAEIISRKARLGHIIGQKYVK
jgi:hypothetical protein